MKVIITTGGYEVLVDDADYDWLSEYKWHTTSPTASGLIYAYRVVSRGDVNTNRLMHREIMGEDWPRYDHHDRNGLNNQRSNLRRCSPSQNQANRPKYSNNRSGYKGVIWDASRKKWRAEISYQGKRLHIGRFDTPQDAASAYDDAARRIHRDFARLNFPLTA